MMTLKQLIERALALPGVFEDYPYGADTPVLRHEKNQKSFAVCFAWEDGSERATLKGEPLENELLRETYAGVIPGYYANKAHWNTVILGDDVPDVALLAMLEKSYALTAPKTPKKNGEKT